jgi:hypothetical protein
MGKVMSILPVENAHTMLTRGNMDVCILLILGLNLQASALSPLPKTYRGAHAIPNWRDAIESPLMSPRGGVNRQF